MGNRAMIVFTDGQGSYSPAVYLHWNGGPESVYTFLDYMADRGCRMSDDPSYASARFCQIVGNHFGGTLSLGLQAAPSNEAGALALAEVGDNGVYVVGPGKGKVRYSVRRGMWNWDNEAGYWLSAAQANRERCAARKHRYNADGEMRKDIEAKNDQFFAPKQEDAETVKTRRANNLALVRALKAANFPAAPRQNNS
jgi:hypothetical protein